MNDISLKDLLIAARQESHRMRHYYLGVEHLFIAMLSIRESLAAALLANTGFAPEYVIDAIRRKIGKGSRSRLWAGIPNNPRVEVVLGIANEIALDHGRQNVLERDVLEAILEESDNIPARVLRALSIDLDELRKAAREIQENPSQRASVHSFVQVEIGHGFQGEVSSDALFILRRMFHNYARIRIEQRLTGGFSTALVLVVTPIQDDQREDASVVVKIGPSDLIQDEAQRYERYVKSTLPPLTARLEDRPTAPELSDLAGLKYTFVSDEGGRARDLRSLLREWDPARREQWLQQDLLAKFGEKWWKQSRPYRFEAWQEYDWLLPPTLTLEIMDFEKPPEGCHVLRAPIKRSRIEELQAGQIVLVENFVVHRVDREDGVIHLALAQGNHAARAYQITIRGIDFEQDTYYRGEIVDQIFGRVWKTRREDLVNSLRALMPDFDLSRERFSLQDWVIPNPIQHYTYFLDRTVEGGLSTIHGDLHLGNIVMASNQSSMLIDFSHTREGHTLFDWANLEISLMAEFVQPLLKNDWESIRNWALVLHGLIPPMPGMDEIAMQAIQTVRAVRSVIGKLLARQDDWQEYELSLAFAALRAFTWETLPVAMRRLCFYRAGLAMLALEQHQPGSSTASGTSIMNATNFTDPS